MKSDLSAKKEQIVFGDDNIVIQKWISGIKGGRTLNVEGFAHNVIKAGHVIIVKNGEYKPMPLTGEAYAALPDGYAYAGVLYRTISAARPEASIMTWGEVNEVAMPYAMESIKDAFKAACPHIDFIKDEEA